MNEHREFSWDGLSFQVPAGWDLSAYDYRGGAGSLRLEDDERVRLEADWAPLERRVSEERVRKQCDRVVAGFRSVASATREIAGLPAGWQAGEHTMADGRRAVTAFCLPADHAVFAHLRLHFEERNARDAEKTIRNLAASFRYHDRGIIPWSFYDVAFRLDRRWRLARTSFLAGRKLMVFEWRLRRLYVWHLSFADRLLQGLTAAEWAAGFLNAEKDLRGPVFEAAGGDRVAAKRSRRYALGHFEELGRWTLRYHVVIHPLPASNQMALAVLNHRSDDDLRDLGLEW